MGFGLVDLNGKIAALSAELTEKPVKKKIALVLKAIASLYSTLLHEQAAALVVEKRESMSPDIATIEE